VNIEKQSGGKALTISMLCDKWVLKKVANWK
jgi:hypothetical protein